jgi:hypothetical protein
VFLDVIRLQTADATAAARFYGDTLGLPVRPEPEAVLVTVGRTELWFEQSDDVRGRPYHVAFNIPENRLDDAREWLAARGVPILHGRVYAFDGWNAHAVYFAEAAGNILELIARHDLPAPPPDGLAFGPRHLLGVSEVALVTDDVPAIAADIERVTGIGPYRPGDAQFTAVGDAEGLFILAARGREWYPETGVRAEALPLTVRARTADGTPFFVYGPPYRVARKDEGSKSAPFVEEND